MTGRRRFGDGLQRFTARFGFVAEVAAFFLAVGVPGTVIRDAAGFLAFVGFFGLGGSVSTGASAFSSRTARLETFREIRSGGSYLSQSDLRPLFGLGSHAGTVDAEVRMPGGRRFRFQGLATNRWHVLELTDASAVAPAR